MAYGKIPNEGEILMGKLVLGKATAENLILRLYKNVITPADSDTAGLYTAVTAAGYADITLAMASWGDPATDGNGIAMATYAEQTFTLTAASDCYGYVLVGATSGKLYAIHPFGANYAFPDNGGSLKITPKLGWVSKEV